MREGGSAGKSGHGELEKLTAHKLNKLNDFGPLLVKKTHYLPSNMKVIKLPEYQGRI